MAAIEKNEIEKAFDIFWKDVKKDARKNLKAVNKDGGRLANRMFDVTKVFKNSVQSEFFIEDYGKFVDKGVRGVGGNKADGTPWRKKKVTNNLYSYKDKRPTASVFDKWAVRKGIVPRSNGKFVSREGLKHALSQTVFHEGIETTNYLTNAFDKNFKTFPQKVGDAYALEVDKFFNRAIKEN